MKNLACALGIPLLLLGCSTAVDPQPSSACRPFTLVSDGRQRTVDHLDFGKEGLGPGDVRMGYRTLSSQLGAPVGHYRWINILLDPPSVSGHRAESLMMDVLALQDGQIHTQSLLEVVRRHDDTDQPHPADFTAAVIGGTGAYSGARGTIDATVEDQVLTFAIDISCGPGLRSR